MKKQARRVFGDVALDDLDSSLSYSPSPRKTSDEEAAAAAAKSKLILSPLMESRNSSDASVMLSNRSLNSSNRSSTSSTGLSEKENTSNRISSTSKQSEAVEAAPAANNNLKQERATVFRNKRSPLRRDLVQKTQAAINKASISVNQSLAAARQAKQADYQHKNQSTQQIRRVWQRDTAEALSFQQQAERNRRELLQLQRELSSKNSQERARREMAQRAQTLQQIEEESQFQSETFRDHQQSLQRQKEESRRRSVALRAKLRANRREGTERLKEQQHLEEQAIWEERHEASLAQRQFAKTNAQKRRQSFAFRNGDARRIRDLHAALEADKLQQQHASLELKWAGEKDAEEYQRQLAQARRESLAGRNATAKSQREQESQQRAEMQVAKHESYELKWAGEQDAEAYQRKLQEARRQSLAQRNQYGRQQREQTSQERFEEMSKEHESHELKWAGEKDAENYQRELEQQRRKSLAFRNQEGKRQRDLGQQQHSEALHAEHESYELKWAAEKDAEDYQRELEKQRRQSFAGRNLEGRRQRLETEQKESEAQVAEHESYELKWAGEKDAEAYQRKVERLRRESLARRNGERVQHANVMEELRVLAREQETESYVLKWAGENDAKAYLAKVEDERRQSLQLRGKQTVHQRQVESEQQQQELMLVQKDEELRSADQKDVEGYRSECAERDRKSLEYRRKEARAQRIQEEERRLKQQEKDETNFALETHANKDVQEYVKECKQRRRLSLAFRAKEKRHHAQWRREQQEREQEERSRRVHDRLMDQRHVELAKQQERARHALEALRHAGYNPFSNVLN